MQACGDCTVCVCVCVCAAVEGLLGAQQYSSTHSYPRHYIEVRVQPHAPATLPPVLIEGWMGPKARLTIRRSFSPPNLVTITTELSRLLSVSHVGSVQSVNSHTEFQELLLCFLHRPCSWQENITLRITESGWERENWIHLAQNTVYLPAVSASPATGTSTEPRPPAI